MGVCGVKSESSKPGFTVTDPALRLKCQKILDYNFDSSTFKPLKEFQDIYTELLGGYILPSRMAIIVLEFKRFMMLRLLTEQQISPPPIIDRFWRVLLGHSRIYAKFCEDMFGYYLHRDSTKMFSVKVYIKTRDLYKNYFRTLNHAIWPMYWSSDQLQRGHHGYVWLWVSNFIEFHTQFSQRSPDKKEDLAAVLFREMQKLRENSKRTLNIQDNRSEAAHSIFRNTFMKRTEFNSLLISEKGTELKGRNKKKISGLDSMESLDEVKESDKETDFYRDSLRMNTSQQEKGFELMHDPVKIQEVKLDVTHTVESEITQERSMRIQTQPNSELDMSPDVPLPEQNNESKELLQYLKPNWIALRNKLMGKLKKVKLAQIVVKNFKFEINSDQKLTQQVFEEYRKYICLIQLLRKRLAIPSFLVKLAHSYHSIQTEQYTKFCQSVFETVVECLPLPRDPSEETFQNYQLTRELLHFVFKESCNEVVWPGIEDAFNYNELYSFKFINIRGYMEHYMELSQLKSKKNKKKLVISNYYDAQNLERAMAKMAVASEPERGEQFILVKQETDKH